MPTIEKEMQLYPHTQGRTRGRRNPTAICAIFCLFGSIFVIPGCLLIAYAASQLSAPTHPGDDHNHGNALGNGRVAVVVGPILTVVGLVLLVIGFLSWTSTLYERTRCHLASVYVSEDDVNDILPPGLHGDICSARNNYSRSPDSRHLQLRRHSTTTPVAMGSVPRPTVHFADDQPVN